MTRKLSRSFFVLAAVMFLTSIASTKDAVKIGVLAKDGPAKVLSIWKITGYYLTVNVTCPLTVKQS